MSNINTVAISGFLAADPEVRWTSDDGESAIVRLGVVVKKSRKDESGEWVETSAIFDVEVFGKFALLVQRKLRKLDNVAVQGKLDRDDWETDSGEKRSKVKIVAVAIDSEGFFRSKDEENAPSESASPAPAAAQESLPTTGPSEDDLPF